MHLRIINNSQFNSIKKDGSITVNDITIPADNQYIYGVVDDPNEVIVLEDYCSDNHTIFPDSLSADLIEKAIQTADGVGNAFPCFYKWYNAEGLHGGCVPLNVYYDSYNGYWKIEFTFKNEFYYCYYGENYITSNRRLITYVYSTERSYNHVIRFTTSVQLEGYDNPVTVQGYLSYQSRSPIAVNSYDTLYSVYLNSYDNKPKLLDALTLETNDEIINLMSVAHITPHSSSECDLTVFYINAEGYFNVVYHTLSAFDSCDDWPTEIH